MTLKRVSSSRAASSPPTGSAHTGAAGPPMVALSSLTLVVNYNYKKKCLWSAISPPTLVATWSSITPRLPELSSAKFQR